MKRHRVAISSAVDDAPAVNDIGDDKHFYHCSTCGTSDKKLLICEGCPRVYHRNNCNAGPCPAGFTYYCPVCDSQGIGWRREWTPCHQSSNNPGPPQLWILQTKDTRLRRLSISLLKAFVYPWVSRFRLWRVMQQVNERPLSASTPRIGFWESSVPLCCAVSHALASLFARLLCDPSLNPSPLTTTLRR